MTVADLSNNPVVQETVINQADTAWMLIACASVLLMTPALAFFYGGMVRSKNALNTMMMSIAPLGVVGVVWACAGYSLAFAPGSDWIGGTQFFFLNSVGVEPNGTIPHILFAMFQGTFAIVTAALISGAVVERIRFGPFLVFISLWTLFVYAPICHWVWGGGWVAKMGALDFAGGTVVHINAAVAAIVAATLVGPRHDYGRQAMLPHNVPYVLLGAGLLWFGWFGFNAGSALAANGQAALAFANTMLAPAGALTVWMVLDMLRVRRTTAIGAATGIVVGLVAVTPAAGFVPPIAAVGIGGLAVVPSYLAIILRSRTRLDDSLDVAAAHGLGGFSGAVLTGVFASAVWGGTDGLLLGNLRQFTIQVFAAVAVMLYSGVVSFALIKTVGAFARLRVTAGEEARGLDVPLHGEEATASGEGALLIMSEPEPARTGAKVLTQPTGVSA